MSGSGWELAVRFSLWLSLPLNAGAAYVLAVPNSWPGQLFELPAEPHMVYRAFAAMWVGLFGLAYGWMALQPRIPRPLLTVGALGKAAAFAIVLTLWLTDQAAQPLLVACFGDLLLAAFWLAWLRATRRPVT